MGDPSRPAGTQLFLLFRQCPLPYGELGRSELISACTGLVSHMVAKHAIDLVVIACNTASTIALPALRASLNIPVVGWCPPSSPPPP